MTLRQLHLSDDSSPEECRESIQGLDALLVFEPCFHPMTSQMTRNLVEVSQKIVSFQILYATSWRSGNRCGYSMQWSYLTPGWIAGYLKRKEAKEVGWVISPMLAYPQFPRYVQSFVHAVGRNS